MSLKETASNLWVSSVVPEGLPLRRGAKAQKGLIEINTEECTTKNKIPEEQLLQILFRK